MPPLNEIIDKRVLIFITTKIIEYYSFLRIIFQTIDRFNIIIIAPRGDFAQRPNPEEAP